MSEVELRRGQVLRLRPGEDVRLYTEREALKFFRTDLIKVRLLQWRRGRGLSPMWIVRCTPLSGPPFRARMDVYQARGLGAR